MAIFRKIGNSFQARIRKTGFPKQSRNFKTEQEARDWAYETEKAMRSNDYQDPKILAKTTVASLIERYRTELQMPEKPFGENKLNTLSRLEDMLGGTLVRDLNLKKLTAFVLERKTTGNNGKGAGGVAISGDIGVLSSVMKVAKSVWHMPVELGMFTEIRTTMKLMRLKTKSVQRKRRPTSDEIARLKAFFRAKRRQQIPMDAIIDFAIATTMRAAEITRIRWDDLNELDHTVIIRERKDPESKEVNDQVVPLLVDAWAIIQAQPRVHDCIFPYKSGSFSTIFPRACKDLKIIDLRFHDLRHEGTSNLFEDGYQIQEVAVFTGHRDWKSLKRYVQLKPENLHHDRNGQLRRAIKLPLEANFVVATKSML